MSKPNRIDPQYSAVDPLAVLLADPESHLSDILYLYFRIYKKKVIGSFFEQAIKSIGRGSSDTFSIADIGASAGFDLVYLLRKLANGFSSRIPFKEVRLSLIEGDEELIETGKQLLGAALPSEGISFEYQKVPFEKGIPLETSSQELLICSEVVEHLQRPEDLFNELYRILKPGGFVIFTTDKGGIKIQIAH